MYKEYFGLEEMPFSIAPDPRYLYMSEQHREALAHLLFGVNSDGGFVLLTGEVGTGKTTVCRCLLEQVPENAAIAFIINPRLTVEELLAAICDEFSIQYPERNNSIKCYVDLINRYLLEVHAKGKRAVLIIDEAQNLSADVLEQLRLLTNLETNQAKLLQIILLGQPELRDKLSRPELRQLSQRITARYHLEALSKQDVVSYVTHRLTVAGVKDRLFSHAAINKLYRLSAGVPRLINVLCDRSLLGAFAHNEKLVTGSILAKASREVFGEPGGSPQLKKFYSWSLGLLMVVIIGAVFAATYYSNRPLTEANKISGSRDIEAKQDIPLSLPPSTVQKTEVVPDTVPITTNSEPASLILEQSKVMAFQAVFKTWNLIYDAQKYSSACDYAQIHGLQCYYERGNLKTLLVLNHPAVLKLINRQGREFYAALTGVRGDDATLVIGDETKLISLTDIESYHVGDCIILWQPPPQYQGVIKAGEQSPLVPWLNAHLAFIQNTPYKPRTDLIYDDELAGRVKEFQKTSGLAADGIIGPLTFMSLNSAEGRKVPVLKGKEEH
jgi:general secretion pathway protein A